MKHILLSVLAGLAGFGSCYAEEDVESSILWGLRAAFDVNVPSKWHYDDGSVKMYKPGCGVTLGGVCNVYLGKGFYLEPGASLYYDTYSYDGIVIGGPEPGVPYQEDPGIYKIGLRVPLVAGYVIDVPDRFQMWVYTGPEFSYSFAGKIKINDDIEDVPDELFGDWQRRADLAWKVGVGFPYKSVVIGVEGAFGLTDLLKSNIRARDNRVSIALTYYL